jgi:hypothetical protein
LELIKRLTESRGGRYLLTFLVLSLIWVPIGAIPGSGIANAAATTTGGVEPPYVVVSGDHDAVEIEWHNVPDNVALVEVLRSTYNGLEASGEVNLTPNGVARDSFLDQTASPSTTYLYTVNVRTLYPEGELPEIERFGGSNVGAASVGESLGSGTITTSALDPDDLDDDGSDDVDGLDDDDSDDDDVNEADVPDAKNPDSAKASRIETRTISNSVGKAETFLCHVPALTPEGCENHEYGSLSVSDSSFVAPLGHFGGACIKSGIIASETWSPGDCPDGYFIEGDLTITGTLTLDPGTSLFLNVTSTVTNTAGVDDKVDIIVEGALSSVGTAGSPVLITSIEANFIDTGGTPFAGNWGVLLFESGSSGSLTRTKAAYGTGVVADEALPAVSHLEINDMSGDVGGLPYRDPSITYSASLDFHNPSGPVSWDNLTLGTPGGVPGAVIYSTTSTVSAGLTATITNSFLSGLAPLQIINGKEDSSAPVTVSISGNTFDATGDAYGLAVISLVFDESGGIGSASVTGAISNNVLTAPAIGGWGFLGAAVSGDGAASHTIDFTGNDFSSYADSSDNIAFSGGSGGATIDYTVSSGNYRSNAGIGWFDLASAGEGGSITIGAEELGLTEGSGNASATPEFSGALIESKGGTGSGCSDRCGLWVGAFAQTGTATAFPRLIADSGVETSTDIGGVYIISEADGKATTDFHLIDSHVSAGDHGVVGYAYSDDAGILLDADLTRSTIKSFNGIGLDYYGEAWGDAPDAATSDVNVLDSSVEAEDDAIQIDVTHHGAGEALIDIDIRRSSLRSNSSVENGSDGVDAMLDYYGGAELEGSTKIKANVVDSTIRTTNGDGLDLDVTNFSELGDTEMDVDVANSTFLIEDGDGIRAFAETEGDGSVTTDVLVTVTEITVASEEDGHGIRATADAAIDTGGDAAATVRLRDSTIDVLDGDEGIQAEARSDDGGNATTTIEITRSSVLTEDDDALDSTANAINQGGDGGGDATTDIDITDSTLSVRSGCCGDAIEADARTDGGGHATITVDVLRSTLFSNDDDGMDLEAHAINNGDGGGGDAEIVVNVTNSSIGVSASDNEESIEANSDSDNGGDSTVEVNIINSTLHSTDDDNLDLEADAVDNGDSGGGDAVIEVNVTDSELEAIEACCDDNIQANARTDGDGNATIDVTVLRSSLRADEDDVLDLDADAVADDEGGDGNARVTVRVTDSEFGLDTVDSEEVIEIDARSDNGGDAIVFVEALNTPMNSIDNIIDINADATSDGSGGGGDAKATLIARNSRWTVPDSSGDQEIDARTDGGGDAAIDVVLTNMDIDVYDGFDLEAHSVNNSAGGDGDARVNFSITDSLFNVFDSSDDHFEVDADSGNGGNASITGSVVRSHLEGFDCCIEQLNLDADATNGDSGGNATVDVDVIDSVMIAQDCCGDGMEIDARSDDGGHASVDVNVERSLFEHEDDNIGIDADAIDDGGDGGGNAFVTVTVTDSELSSIDCCDANIDIDADAGGGGHASILVTIDPSDLLAGDENVDAEADANNGVGGGNAAVTVTVLDSILQSTDCCDDNIDAQSRSSDGGDAFTRVEVRDSDLSAGDENVNAEAHAASGCCNGDSGGGDAQTIVIVHNTPMHNHDCCDDNIEADSFSSDGGDASTVVTVSSSPMSSDDENIDAGADAAGDGCCALGGDEFGTLANGGGGDASVIVTVTDSPMQSADSSDDNIEIDAFASDGGDASIVATVLRSDMVAGDDNIDADAETSSGGFNGDSIGDFTTLVNGNGGGDASIEVTVIDSEMIVPEGGSSDSNFELDASTDFGGTATIELEGSSIDARTGGGHGIDAEADAGSDGCCLASSVAPAVENGSSGGNAHVTTTVTNSSFLTKDEAVMDLISSAFIFGDATVWTDLTNVSLTSLDGCDDCSGEGIQAFASGGIDGNASYGGPLTDVDIDSGGHAIEADAITSDFFIFGADIDVSPAANGFSSAIIDPTLERVNLKSGHEDGMNLGTTNFSIGDSLILPELTDVGIDAPNSDGTVFGAFGWGGPEGTAIAVVPLMTNVDVDVENHGLEHVAEDVFNIEGNFPHDADIVVAGQFDTLNINSNGGPEEVGEALQMFASNFDSSGPAVAAPEFQNTNAEFLGSSGSDVLAFSWGCIDEVIVDSALCDETNATGADAFTSALFHPGSRLNWTSWKGGGFELSAITLDGAGDAINTSEVRSYHVRSYYNGIDITALAIQAFDTPAGDAFVDTEVIDNIVEPFAASGGNGDLASGIYIESEAFATETVTATANGIVASNLVRNHSEHGIYFYAGNGPPESEPIELMDALIAGNTVLNVGAYGIWAGTSVEVEADPSSIARVIDNVVDRTGSAGILLTGVVPDVRSNVQRRSGFGDFGGPGVDAGIAITSIPEDAESRGLVQCNSVAGNTTGIHYSGMGTGTDPATNDNNFVDVVDPGLTNGPRNLVTFNTHTATDATMNWWGPISPAAIDASAENEEGPDVDHSEPLEKLACTGGYLLEGFGGVHAYGGTPAVASSGGYTAGVDSARAIVTLSNEDPALSRKSGYFVNRFGTIFSFGGAPAASGGPLFGFDIARDIVLLPDGTGGYVLDGFGGIHPFSVGANPAPPAAVGGPSFHGFGDIARKLLIRPDGQSGYLVDGFGGVHTWATGDDPLPPVVSGAYFYPRDVVNDAVLNHRGQNGYLLDHSGGMHPFSTTLQEAPPLMTTGPYWPSKDVARAITRYVDGSAYMMDFFGGRHITKSFPAPLPPSLPGPYFSGFDIARDIDGVRYP